MRSLAIGLAAVLALGMGSAAAAQENGAYAPSAQSNPNQPIDPRAQSAYDQAQEANRKAKGSKTDKAAAAASAKGKEKGMADTPALLQQAGYSCTPSDANYLGVNKTKDDKGKETQTNIYEVACPGTLGYLVMSKEGSPPEAYDCLKLAAAQKVNPKALTCALPENANPLPALQPFVAKAGITCTINKARFFGSNSTNKVDDYEVGCAEGGAYILVIPAPGSTRQLVAESCFSAAREGVSCEYQPKETIVAQIKTMAAGANRTNCQITDASWVGQAANKHDFYEIACADGKSGFMIETDGPKFLSAIDCARATAIGGGCKLTTISEGDTSDSATYTKLSKESGYDCAVTSYRSFGVEPNGGREIVELACSNHPAGTVAFLPTGKGQTGDFINCARADARGLKCGLAKPDATYAAINDQLKALGKDCPVNGARGMGHTESGDDYVEVTCSTGGGLVLHYGPGREKLSEVLACAQAKGIGEGCKLQK